LAVLAASKIESTLGPMGALKMVTYHRGPELVGKITKDPTEIVSELGVQYPALKTLEEAAKIHRRQVGDGVSTMLILVAALIVEAQDLIGKGVHPSTILRGYHKATIEAISVIGSLSVPQPKNQDERLLETIDCGSGLLTRKFRKLLSEAADYATFDGFLDLTTIKVVRRIGRSSDQSGLIRGVAIKKPKSHPSMPDRVEDPKVALVTRKLEIRPLESKMKGEGRFPTKLTITHGGQLPMFKSAENRMREEFAEKAQAIGVEVLLCRSKIDERVADKLARKGIFALQMVDQEDLEAVAKATGARIVADVDHLTTEDLGAAQAVEVDTEEPNGLTVLKCGRGCSLLLRGSSPERLDELEKIAKRGLLILKHSRADPKVVPGGGAIYVPLANRLRDYARRFPGREQLAIESFANALEKIPECLSSNLGLNKVDTMIRLHARHANGESMAGVADLEYLASPDAYPIELTSVNKATIRRAYEVTSLLLRVDSYFSVKDLPLVHKK